MQPLDVASIAGYEHLAPNVRAYPLLRRSADVPGPGTSAQGITVVGLPAQAFERMYWRSDFASVSHSGLTHALGRDGPATLAGPVLPSGSVAFREHVRLRGTPIHLTLVLQDRRGRIDLVSLGRIDPGERTVTARIATSPVRLKVVALELELPKTERNWLFIRANHGRAVRALAGSIRLGAVTTLDSHEHGRTRIDMHRWVARGGATATTVGRDVDLHYAFPDARTIVFRPREPTDGRPLRIIASPDVARSATPGGLLTLDFFTPSVRARVVGVATRFPTLQPGEPFAIAEETRLATVLTADAPGTGTPDELWLSSPGGSLSGLNRTLSHPPFAALERTSRQQTLRSLEADPMARAIEYVLGIAALLSLALAVIGFWVTLLSDLRDERGDFFDLEAQGVGPETLRRHLRIRGVGLVCFGLLGGILLGFVLARLVVSLVQVSAETGSPEPPLVFSPGLVASAVVLGTLVVAAATVGEASTRHAFRGATPERASWGLE